MERITKDNYRKLGFHKGWYSGVPIYIRENEENGEFTPEVTGINWFWDKMLQVVTWINLEIRQDEGFIFKVLIEDDEYNKKECNKSNDNE